MENDEPKIDCENTNCDECWYNEWCNTYQDSKYDELWEEDDCDDCENCEHFPCNIEDLNN